MKHLLFFFFFIVSQYGVSQTTISGTVKNTLHEAVTGASVIVLENDTTVVAFDITDGQGKYKISVQTPLSILTIKVRFLGYQDELRVVENKNQALNFELKDGVTELKEVIVKSQAIERVGDTLNYNVKSFADGQDRVIADVLAKMPGIDVLSDGRILYQGKPINKYYIEGLDLLEGKYNLANQNLPYDKVSSVQIIENHQPIKAIDSLVFSNNAALNIKLKNNVSFTGQGFGGLGASPLLWQGNITPMLFAKNQQMIASYQTNNMGENTALQIKTLTIENLMESLENNEEKKDWLSITTLNNPQLNSKRWLDNNVHLVTQNYLKKLSKNYELRLNVSYLNDYQQQKGYLNNVYITPLDTLVIVEDKYNQLYFNALQSNITLQKNTKDKYIKNSLQFQGFWDSQRGNIAINGKSILQDLKNPYFNMSNNFKTLIPVKKHILTLNSHMNLSQTPQELTVNSGRFFERLSGQNNINHVMQNVKLNDFYTNNYISFITSFKDFTIAPKMGFQAGKQVLQTGVLVNSEEQLSDVFANNFDWFSTKSYVSADIQYRKDKWKAEFTPSLNYYTFNLKDAPLNKKQNEQYLTFEPRFSVGYDLNAFLKLSSSVSLNNQFGTINQMHYAFILKNYRSIQRMNTDLPEVFTKNFNTGISYRNAIKSLFASLMYMYSDARNNLLYSNNILDNTAIELQAIEQTNDRLKHSISGRVGKYFSSIKSNFSLGASLASQRYLQILNKQLTTITMFQKSLNAKANMDVSKYLSFDYVSEMSVNKSVIQRRGNQNIFNQVHSLNINIYPRDNQYFGIKTEFLKNTLLTQKNSSFFADLIYRYTWKRNNSSLEFQWNNILNNQVFRTVQIDAFSYIESGLNLRPRQFTVKANFSF
jgi:hypothetical protein